MWEYGPGPRATGAIWSQRAVVGSRQEVGWAVVGLRCADYAASSVWLALVFQTVLPELGSGATGSIWSRRAVAGPGPDREFGFGL